MKMVEKSTWESKVIYEESGFENKAKCLMEKMERIEKKWIIGKIELTHCLSPTGLLAIII